MIPLIAMLVAVQDVPPPTVVQSPALPALHLICRGIGDHAVTHSNFGMLFGRHGTASTIGTSQEQDQFGEQMDIDLTGDAKARVPRRFLPAFHGGEGGWFGIKDLVVSDDAITGTVLINYTNHPKLRIDRRTGAVDLDGKVGSYAGKCEPYDPANEKRVF